MIESDHRTYGPVTTQRILAEKEAAGAKVDKTVLELPAAEFGRPRAGQGNWGSLIRVLDPIAVSWVVIVSPILDHHSQRLDCTAVDLI